MIQVLRCVWWKSQRKKYEPSSRPKQRQKYAKSQKRKREREWKAKRDEANHEENLPQLSSVFSLITYKHMHACTTENLIK